MSKTIKHTIKFKSSPKVLYDALLNAGKHKAFTRQAATVNNKIGKTFSAYSGFISGMNLDLAKNKRIVQAWRCADFPVGHYSIVSYEFRKTGTGTTLVFTQEAVPDKSYKHLNKGWYRSYWLPLKEKYEK